MYCIGCGTRLDEDAMFCMECGKPVPGEHKNHSSAGSIYGQSLKRFIGEVAEKKKFKKITIGLVALLVIFLFIKEGVGGGSAAIEEVKKMVTFDLEDEYGEDYISSISFSRMDADKLKENVVVVTGDVDYELRWESTDRIDKEARTFIYYMQYVDGVWSIKDPHRRGDGGGSIIINQEID